MVALISSYLTSNLLLSQNAVNLTANCKSIAQTCEKNNIAHSSLVTRDHIRENVVQKSYPVKEPICSLSGCGSSDDYASAIESCRCIEMGRQIHAHVLKAGYDGHGFLETKLLQMYGKCGSLKNARILFDKMPVRNMYTWTGIITEYTGSGQFEEALTLFQMLQTEEIGLEFFIFPIVFKACSGLLEIDLGSQLHGLAVKEGFVSNIYVGNAMLDMYGKCGRLDDARKLFEKMPETDRVSWNSMVSNFVANGLIFEALDVLDKMQSPGGLSPNLVTWSAAISGFSQNGCDKEALLLLYQMQDTGIKPNARTLASVLPACARLELINSGKELHGYIVRHGFMSNPYVINGLVDIYRRCADMDSASKIFSKFSVRNLVSFNTMIVGYCDNGQLSKGKEMFNLMNLEGVDRDRISWNSMISGCANNYHFDEALSLFTDMQMEEGIEADSFTLGSVLSACASLLSLPKGKEIHSYAIIRGLNSNPFVGGALIEMYSKCLDIKGAQAAFNGILEKDITTWNSLVSGYSHCNKIDHINRILNDMEIDGFSPNIYTWNGILNGYVENGHHEAAVKLFSDIQKYNLEPDVYTVGIILPACSRMATFGWAKQIHAYSIRRGYEKTTHVGAALVDMYSKCGTIVSAKRCFSQITHHNLVTRNTMLSGYAMHGHGHEGIDLFHQILTDGIRPDEITFLSILSLCVHSGEIDKGWDFFNLMSCYGIQPNVKHYNCMIDLLSRAGQLTDAYVLMMNMPMEPDGVMWNALLVGCVIHGNVHLGEISANQLIEIEPSNSGNYVLLANLYASTGRWIDLARTRQIINDRGMQKIPGCSWIEIGDEIHVLLASDRSHQNINEIYSVVENLTILMRQEGYITDKRIPNVFES